jgi:hypothetical protein
MVKAERRNENNSKSNMKATEEKRRIDVVGIIP